MGITNAKKTIEWQHVTEAVNAASSEGQTLSEIKKSWSILKAEAKRRIADHTQSVCATGGGKGITKLPQGR